MTSIQIDLPEHFGYHLLSEFDESSFDLNVNLSPSLSPLPQTFSEDTLYIHNLDSLYDTIKFLKTLSESGLKNIKGVHLRARDEWPEDWFYEFFPEWIEEVPVRLSPFIPNLKLLVLENVLWSSKLIKSQQKIIKRFIRFLRLDEIRFLDCRFWEFENVTSFVDMFPGLTRLSFDSSAWESAFVQDTVHHRISLQSLRIEGKLYIAPFIYWLRNSSTHGTLKELTLEEVDNRTLESVDRFLHEMGSSVQSLTIGCNFTSTQLTPVLRETATSKCVRPLL